LARCLHNWGYVAQIVFDNCLHNPNKFLAKLASDFQKPDGLTVVTPQHASQFLDATPIRKFFGVGKVTEARLKELGIQRGADLKQVSEEQLRTLFDERGSMLHNFVRGEDHQQIS